MTEPTISLRGVKALALEATHNTDALLDNIVPPSSYYAKAAAQYARDLAGYVPALVEAVEAMGKLTRCPLCGVETRYADGTPWESHKADCALARFSDLGTEAGT